MEDLSALQFDARGLIPAIVQDVASGQVLTLAYMNREAIAKTLTTGLVHFWSRSRGQPWQKGETSGHIQHVREIRYDCDADTLLILVEPEGAACHTGERSCFFRHLPGGPTLADPPTRTLPPEGGGKSKVPSFPEKGGETKVPSSPDGGGTAEVSSSEVGARRAVPLRRPEEEGATQVPSASEREAATHDLSPARGEEQEGGEALLHRLYEVILDRKHRSPQESYVASLFARGQDQVLKKVIEEAAEVALASKNGHPQAILSEMADLWFHTLVALGWHNLPPHEVLEVLRRRFGVSGLRSPQPPTGGGPAEQSA